MIHCATNAMNVLYLFEFCNIAGAFWDIFYGQVNIAEDLWQPLPFSIKVSLIFKGQYPKKPTRPGLGDIAEHNTSIIEIQQG